MPGHLPYRGEVYPKQRGHRWPQQPGSQAHEKFFWFSLILGGILLLVWAVLTYVPFLFFICGIYWMFLMILILASQDAKKIKTITSDKDEENSDGLLEDYLAQVEWRQSHRYSRMPEPKWRYRRVLAKSEPIHFGYFVVIAPVIFALTIASYFGANSPIAALAAIIIGIISIFAFLIIQSSRD